MSSWSRCWTATPVVGLVRKRHGGEMSGATEPMSVERLREIRERWAQMPAPPWHAGMSILKVYVYSDDGELGFSLQSMHPRDGHDVPAEMWGKTLAEASEHVRDLLAEVKRLQDELAERDKLVAALTETAEWAFGAGGWDLWQYGPEMPAGARSITNYDEVATGDTLKLRIDNRVAGQAEREG